MINAKTYDKAKAKATSSLVAKMFAIPLLGFALTGCQTNGGITDHTNGTIESFKVAPHTEKCVDHNYSEHECLVVNGQVFNDTIEGFNYQWGHSYSLKVKKTLTCPPNVTNSCPPPRDGNIYDYELIEIVYERQVDSIDDTLKTLEVVGFDSTGNKVMLKDKDNMRYHAELESPYATGVGFNEAAPLDIGDRVKIEGIYLESDPIQIVNVGRVTLLGNPDRAACESTPNKAWRTEGKAQTATCVTLYSDAGKSCQSSSECEGNCMVHDYDLIDKATCASSDSKFGCGATIEQFKLNGNIICVD